MSPEIEAKLPGYCAAKHPTTGKTVLIKRGERGFWPAYGIPSADIFNRERGITDHQREAMLIGSMFGWDVPGVAHELLFED